ncbi:unnamed protein product [Closterium sp. NIES-65]|nr:unnamed protein product [Closterium sp. NIES-65]
MAGTMKRTRKLQISCGDEEDDSFPSHGLWEIRNADVDSGSTIESKPGGATGSGSGAARSSLETSLVRESSVIPTPSTTTTVTTSIADFNSSGYGDSVSSAWDHILGSDATPTGSGGRGLHDSPLTPTPPTPIHDKILQSTSIEIGHVGTLTWRQLAVDRDLRLISWWHHVPLYSRDGLLNFVCATPRGSWIKYEVAQNEEFTPLRISQFPSTNGYSKPAHFAENATRFTLGFLPQTYADPAQPNPDYGGLAYQGGPMDALLLDLNDASRAGFASSVSLSNSMLPSRDLRTGDVCQVRVVGAFAVVQQKSRLSWKLLAIPAAPASSSRGGGVGEDDVADRISDVADVHALFPGLLDDIREWLRFCDCVDPDDEENEFGLNQRAGAADVALAIIAQAHASWQLLTDDSPPPSPWSPANLVLSARVLQEKWRKYTDQYYNEADSKGDRKSGSWEGERGGRAFSVGSLGSWQGGGGSGSLSGGGAAAAPPLNLPFVPFSDPTTSRAERRFDRAWEETSRAGSFAGSSTRSFLHAATAAAANGDADGSGVGNGLRFGGSYKDSRVSSYGGSSEGPTMVGGELRTCKSGPMVVRFGVVEREEREEGSNWGREMEGNQEEEEEGHGSRSYRSVECGGMQSEAPYDTSHGPTFGSSTAFAAAGDGGWRMKARRKSGSWDFGNMTVGGVWIPDALAARNSVTTDNTVTSLATAAFADTSAPDENLIATVAEVTNGNRVTLAGNKAQATEHSRGFPLFRHSSLNRALLNDHRTALARLGALWGTGGGSDRPPPEPDTQVRESSKPDGEVRGSSKPDGAVRAVQRRWGGWRYGPMGGRMAESPSVGGGGIGGGRRRRGTQGTNNWPSLSSSSFGDASIADTLDLASPRTSLSDAWDQALVSSLDDDASLLSLPPVLASLWDTAGAVATGAIAGSVRGGEQQGGSGGACVALQTREILAFSHRLVAGVEAAAAAAAVVAERVGEAAATTGGGGAAGSAAAAAAKAEQEGVCSIGNGRQQIKTVDSGLGSGGEAGGACSRVWAPLECNASAARMDPCDCRLGDSSGMQGSSRSLGARPVTAASSIASVASTSSVVTAAACHGTGMESPKAEMRGMGEDGTGVGEISLGISLPTTPSLPSSLPSPTSTVSSATISIPRTYSSSGYGLSPPNLRGQVRSEVLQLPAWVDERLGARGNGEGSGMGRAWRSEELDVSGKERECAIRRIGSLGEGSAVGSGISETATATAAALAAWGACTATAAAVVALAGHQTSMSVHSLKSSAHHLSFNEAAYTKALDGDQFSTPAYKGDATHGDNCGGLGRGNGEGVGEKRGVPRGGLKQSLSWEERGGSKAVSISHPLLKVFQSELQGAEGTESEGEERREQAWERKREEEREREWEREKERFVVGSVSFREAARKEERGSESKGVMDKEDGGVMATGGCVGGSAQEERSRKMKRQVSFNSVVKVYEYDNVQ